MTKPDPGPSSSMQQPKLPIHVNGRWLSKPLTGTGRYATEVTKALLAAGHDVVLWVPSDAQLPSWASRARVRRARTRGQLFEQVTLPWLTRRQTLLSMGGPAPALKKKQVVVLHDATPFRLPQTYSKAFASWYRWMYRAISRSGAQIATVSTFSADELADVLHHPRSNLVLAEPAATLAATETELQQQLPKTFFLTVGTLAQHKNLVPVIAAFARAGLKVVTVGTSGASQVFTSVGLPADAGILHLGRISDEELLLLYRRAQALVFPSFYEGFGLPVLEAQQAGCIVIASNAGPLPALVGDSALLADPHSPEAFVAAAERLLGSIELQDELRSAGRTNASRFGWSRTADVLAAAVADQV